MSLLENVFTLLKRKESAEEKEIRALQILFAGELSAVDCYKLALRTVEDKQLIPVLEECLLSHRERTQDLEKRLESFHLYVPESSGCWGSIAHFAEFCAGFISDRAMMSVLAAGEDFGYDQYIIHMPELDSDSYQHARAGLFPAQAKTWQTMTLLCAWMKSEELAMADGRGTDLPGVVVLEAAQASSVPIIGENLLPKAS